MAKNINTILGTTDDETVVSYALRHNVKELNISTFDIEEHSSVKTNKKVKLTNKEKFINVVKNLILEPSDKLITINRVKSIYLDIKSVLYFKNIYDINSLLSPLEEKLRRYSTFIIIESDKELSYYDAEYLTSLEYKITQLKHDDNFCYICIARYDVCHYMNYIHQDDLVEMEK